MDINSAIEHALDGDAVLFVGSGFSIGATSVSDKNFPLAKELALNLSKEIDENYPIEDLFLASEAYLSAFGPAKLIEFLSNTFVVKNINDNHLNITEIPWKAIYTR